MSDYELSPSKITSFLYPHNIHDLAEAALNAQPSIRQDERGWKRRPTNYAVIYEDESTLPEETKRNFKASSLMHDTTNELISQAYENGVAVNPEGIERVMDRVLEAQHPTLEGLNMEARELQNSHGLDSEDIEELQVWGKRLGGVKRDIAEELPDLKAKLNGDRMRPQTERYKSSEYQGRDFSSRADLNLEGNGIRETVETKIKWVENPDLPEEDDIVQARLTARHQGSSKAYLAYAAQGEVHEFAPMRDEEMEIILEKIEPLLESVNELAGWDSNVEEMDPLVKDLIRRDLEEIVRDFYRNEVIGSQMTFKHHQSPLEAYCI